jgi:hypothetical protein
VAAEDLERHVQLLLTEEVGLDTESIAAALDHLGGPAVSDRAESLLQLARASIRYDFGPIKRVAYDCTQGLGRRATLEAIASVSLANALARLETLQTLSDSAAD